MQREEYLGIYRAWRATCDEIAAFGLPDHPANVELRREQDLALRAAGCCKKLRDEERSSILSEVKTRVGETWAARVSALRTTRRTVESALDEAADLVLPLPGPEPRLVREYWESTRRDTGRGDEYARGLAELKLLTCRAAGVRAEVVRVPPLDAYGCADYHVRAWVLDDVDVDLLQRRSIPLREAVRLCWGRSINPRVLIPTLPHGYEERAGLDLQGNDLRAGTKAAGSTFFFVFHNLALDREPAACQSSGYEQR